MFSSQPRGSYMDDPYSQIYSKEVLVSQWQNRREKPAEPNDCIVPVLDRVNACEHHLTEFTDNFSTPWSGDCVGKTRNDGTRNYLGARNDAQANYMLNRQSQLRFPLTEALKRNFTSTYKVLFDMIPKHVKAHTVAIGEQNVVPARPIDVDMTRSYGNKSRTGTRCMLRKAVQLEKIQRLQTTYAAEYDMAATIARLAYKRDN